MVAQQVLRELGLAVAVVAAVAGSAAAERVGVLDLRAAEGPAQKADRARLASELAGAEGIQLVGGELAAALAGLPYSAWADAGRQALAEGRRAAETGDCAAALDKADAAAVALAAARATGAASRDELAGAYALALRCADRVGQVDRAVAAAGELRALGAGDPPPGVDEALWQRYPAIDAAANVLFAPLEVASVPPGARVWVDHREIGTAPLETFVPQGAHLVAVARGGRAAADIVTVGAGGGQAELTLPTETARWGELQRRVAAWRRGEGRVDPAAVTALMSEAQLGALVSFEGDGGLAVWTLPPGSSRARPLGLAPTPVAAAALLTGKRGPGIDPNQPLLRETPQDRARLYGLAAQAEDDGGQEWWVWATVAGAAGLAVLAVLAHDLGDDRQRIEITLP